MIFDAGGNLIEVDDGGIYKRSSPTTDTGIWTALNNGLGISEFHSVDYDANKNAILNAKLSFANCAHFGCHGEFEPDSPLESSLVSSQTKLITQNN